MVNVTHDGNNRGAQHEIRWIVGLFGQHGVFFWNNGLYFKVSLRCDTTNNVDIKTLILGDHHVVVHELKNKVGHGNGHGFSKLFNRHGIVHFDSTACYLLNNGLHFSLALLTTLLRAHRTCTRLKFAHRSGGITTKVTLDYPSTFSPFRLLANDLATGRDRFAWGITKLLLALALFFNTRGRTWTGRCGT